MSSLDALSHNDLPLLRDVKWLLCDVTFIM